MSVTLSVVDSQWSQTAVAAAYSHLLPAEKQRVDRMCESGKAQLTVSLFVRRPLLAQATALPESELTFTRDDLGKQLLVADRRWHFNVADTEGCVVVAISRDQEVGVDAEAFDRSIANLNDFVSACLSPAEQDWLRQLQGDEKKAWVLKAWVIKEAYTKRLGMGLSFGFQRITVLPDIASPTLVVDGKQLEGGDFLSLWTDYLDHYIALSVVGGAPSLRIKLLKESDFSKLF